MYLNVYAVSKIAEARLTELREERARIALLESVRDPRAGVGARVGAALIRLGRWLGAGEPGAGRSARTGGDWSARAA
jgi:hypothetical protein